MAGANYKKRLVQFQAYVEKHNISVDKLKNTKRKWREYEDEQRLERQKARAEAAGKIEEFEERALAQRSRRRRAVDKHDKEARQESIQRAKKRQKKR